MNFLQKFETSELVKKFITTHHQKVVLFNEILQKKHPIFARAKARPSSFPKYRTIFKPKCDELLYGIVEKSAILGRWDFFGTGPQSNFHCDKIRGKFTKIINHSEISAFSDQYDITKRHFDLVEGNGKFIIDGQKGYVVELLKL